jgi:hypothetical protein
MRGNAQALAKSKIQVILARDIDPRSEGYK